MPNPAQDQRVIVVLLDELRAQKIAIAALGNQYGAQARGDLTQDEERWLCSSTKFAPGGGPRSGRSQASRHRAGTTLYE
jgi:hypothetical protein